MSTFQLFSFGVVVHIVFLFAVFDIYFKSTVILGVPPINNSIPQVGKRVVLISVDGLRANSLYDRDSEILLDVMPFVKSIMEDRGTWGISESYVPTESRPGHVAMLAGFYEDPSAVTKGWKENPVTFDSIFNQTACSFAWGSSDILHIFFKGLEKECAFSHSYENEQNFAGDTMEYDNWVEREFRSFLQSSKNNSALFQNGVLFFLHLLGQDTAGHTHKPHSEKYIENTKNVDRIVREIETLINEFYNDNMTTFVFTSDHGMTDWGSHGAGHPNETNTPFIAWGVGINKPAPGFEPVNINQADITPLLSVLLGSPIPVNSIGIIPLQYLNMSNEHKAEAMLLNAKQIAAQFQTNLEKVKSQIIPIFHSPFEKLTVEEVQMMTSSISEQIRNRQFTDAIQKSKVLIQIGLEGLEYYHNYYQRLLLVAISSSYILWIIYLALEIFHKNKPIHNGNVWPLKAVFCASASITLILILIQRMPHSYIFYFLLPQILFLSCWRKFRKFHFLLLKKNVINLIISLLMIVSGVEVIVGCFFQRYLLSISLIFTFIWSLSSIDFKKVDKATVSVWFISGVILSGFCLLPIVNGQPNVILLVFSGFIVFVFLIVLFLSKIYRENIFLFCIRCLSVATAAWNNAAVHANFSNHNQLSSFNQFLSWGLTLFALIFLMVGKGKPYLLERLDQLFMGFLVPFLLLSITHEGLFIVFLFIHLRTWIYVEYKSYENDKIKEKYPSFSEFRRAYLFLLYVWVGFFGLGNIASLNSFDPAWVRCYLTVFSPFLMSSLILFKTVIPFLLVSCSMRVVTVMLKIRPDELFVILLIYCNMMGLNFLFLITNKGSWLDIGSSISHYVIQQVTIVFLLVLYGVAKFLMSFSLPILTDSDKSRKYSKSELNGFISNSSVLTLPSYYANHKLHRS